MREEDILKTLKDLEGEVERLKQNDFQNHVLTMLTKLEKRLEVIENKGTKPVDREAGDLNDYGVQLYYLKEWDQALEVFKSAHEKDPDCFEILNNLAVVQSLRGEEEAAKEWFQKAIAKNPEQVALLNNRGVLGILQADPTEAISILERAHFREPQNQTVLYNLAQAYQLQEQPQKAVQMFRLLLGINPEHREAAYQLRKYYQ